MHICNTSILARRDCCHTFDLQNCNGESLCCFKPLKQYFWEFNIIKMVKQHCVNSLQEQWKVNKQYVCQKLGSKLSTQGKIQLVNTEFDSILHGP